MAIELGKVYTDKITGFKGVATSRTEYINCCARIALQPQELHNGVPIEPQVFDELQLVEYVPLATELKTGGPGFTARQPSINSQR